MSRIVWSAAARNDLDEIWLYVAQDNLETADTLVDRLTEIARPLADFPQMGVARTELADGLRSLTVGSYVLFYSAQRATIRIERVLHGRRDITAALF